ncbi:MAG: hypothetical protein DWQ10_15295 [Calditrichaeota bacterium]|nr:MAG: hypothetical protein DWQ10_15295 [Calditrichota bacterium]
MVGQSNSMMKMPLILAAAIIIIRIVLEQLGSPQTINPIFGVAWLYFLVPIYFALEIKKSGSDTPYKSLFATLGFFAIYTRLMVFVTYMLAWWLQWPAPRFSLDQGGVVGEGVSALQGLLIIPLRNAVIWIIFAVIIGMLIGWITMVIKSSRNKAGAYFPSHQYAVHCN